MMLPLLGVSFRDSKGGDGLRRPLRLSSVGRRTIAKGSHEWCVSQGRAVPSLTVK
jgi:hypothetical protein